MSLSGLPRFVSDKFSQFLQNLDTAKGAAQTSLFERFRMNWSGAEFKNKFSQNDQALFRVAQQVQTVRSNSTQQQKTKTTTPPAIRAPKIDLQTTPPPEHGRFKTETRIFPLNSGRQKAGYEELARKTVQAALEMNGIHPSNLEMEEIVMRIKDNRLALDMHNQIMPDWSVKDLPGLMPEVGNHKDASGKTVRGYEFTYLPDFQEKIIDEYNNIKTGLAAPENTNRQAVIDMTQRERLTEAVKIAWEKGYVSDEVKAKLKGLTFEEIAGAMAGGAIFAAAAKSKTAGPAAAAVGGALLLKWETERGGAALRFGDKCARATTRADLDVAAKDFGALMGDFSKDGVLMAAGLLGAAKQAGRLENLPRIDAGLLKLYGNLKELSGLNNLKMPTFGLPEPVPARAGVPTRPGQLPTAPMEKPIFGAPPKIIETITQGRAGQIAAKPQPIEARSIRGEDIGGSRAPVEGRGIPNRGKGAPEWNNADTPPLTGDGKPTGALKGHAGKHGGDRILPPEAQKYYDQAVQNMNYGAKFEYTHNGQIKTGYITKIGKDEYLFTGCSRNSKSIFTHYIMKKEQFKNIGITFKQTTQE